MSTDDVVFRGGQPMTDVRVVAGVPTKASSSARCPYLAGDVRFLLLAIAYALFVFGFEWYRHATYRSLTGDLAYMDQGVWLMAHGHMPEVTVIGRNIFEDHFAPILTLFVPFYVIVSTPLWLLAGQALALGVGLLALPSLLDVFHLSPAWRKAFIVSYIASPLLWSAALFDFHTATLAVPFLVLGITAALRDDARMLVLMAAATLLMRDDLGLAVVGFLLIGVTQSQHRRLRLSTAVFAIAWVVVAGRFSQAVGSAQVWQAHYGYLGANSTDALLHPFRTGWRLTAQMWSMGTLLPTVGWLVPLAFLPLLSPRRMLCGFLWVSVLFASTRWTGGDLLAYHHGAPVLPFLLVAAATGVSRLQHERVNFIGPVGLVVFAVCSLVVTNPYYSWISRVHAPPPSVAGTALANIGPEDHVTATWTLTAHLSHRLVLLPFPYPFMRGDFGPFDSQVTRVGPDLVSEIDAVAIYFPGDPSSLRLRRAFLRLPSLREFRLVFERDGLMVYRRVEPSR